MEEGAEGFICPICLEDKGDISLLQTHFTEDHRNDEDKDVILQFKGLLGRAKQRILNFDPVSFAKPENFSYGDRSALSQEHVTDIYAEPQENGAIRRHTQDFMKIRDCKIDLSAVETNKLIIRLDKLISQTPSDPSKRKAFEKEVIPWVDDSSTQFCEFCGNRFSITKRKHHCRLCGKIMCNNCSQFLTFLAARKLTNPAFAAGYEGEGEVKREKSPSSSPGKKAEKILTATLSLLKRDGSEISLGSLLNQDGEDHLRVCPRCKELLKRREDQMEQRTQSPSLVHLYERLSQLVTEVGNVFPSYCHMAESLNCGESMYTLSSAKELKVKVLKLQEQIDIVSKKIFTYGLDQVEGMARSPREVLLQKNIRTFALSFLHNMVVAIPELPSDSVYAELQLECKERVHQRITAERAAAAAVTSNSYTANKQSTTTTYAGGKEESRRLEVGSGGRGEGEGWTPDIKPTPYNPFLDEEDDTPIDPLQQQIGIIKGFLRQAAESGRLDEVRLLENNLRELETEMKHQQMNNNLSSPHSLHSS